jgi:hypothetical protein
MTYFWLGYAALFVWTLGGIFACLATRTLDPSFDKWCAHMGFSIILAIFCPFTLIIAVAQLVDGLWTREPLWIWPWSQFAKALYNA